MSQAIQKSADTQPKPAERFYLPELDVLRFLAAFAVFIYHLPISGLLFYKNYGVLGELAYSGIFGVDLFFTLSGYLLTSLLLRERDRTGDINLKAFYARRTLRIWPLYYFVIALTFILSHLPASVTTVPFFGNMFPPMPARMYAFLAIFLFNFDFGNGGSSGRLPVMFPLWSISVEEQFYLIWPWCARYLARKRIVVVPIAMIAIACIVRAISLPLKLDTLVWTNTFTRLDPIAVGILIALLPRFELRLLARLGLVAFGLASWWFAVHYCSLSLQVSTLAISIGYPAVALGSGAFLLASIGAKRLRENSYWARSLTYLGKISYGLYVYNPITKTAVMIILLRWALPACTATGWPGWIAWTGYTLLSFGLDVTVASASYLWIESPFLRLKERFARIPSRAV